MPCYKQYTSALCALHPSFVHWLASGRTLVIVPLWSHAVCFTMECTFYTVDLSLCVCVHCTHAWKKGLWIALWVDFSPFVVIYMCVCMWESVCVCAVTAFFHSMDPYATVWSAGTLHCVSIHNNMIHSFNTPPWCQDPKGCCVGFTL